MRARIVLGYFQRLNDNSGNLVGTPEGLYARLIPLQLISKAQGKCIPKLPRKTWGRDVLHKARELSHSDGKYRAVTFSLDDHNNCIAVSRVEFTDLVNTCLNEAREPRVQRQMRG